MPVNGVSIIVEWDNGRLSEQWRAKAMFAEVASQVAAIENKFEVLVVFDKSEVDGSHLESLVGQSDLATVSNLTTTCHGFDDLHYYQLKNAGAELSMGEILVFVDSDVIPLNGWLAEIIDTFESPGVDLIGGNTYVGPFMDLYSRTYALCSYFDLPDEPGPAVEAVKFFGNNFAVRRKVYFDFPFARDPEKFRTQAEDYRNHLKQNGIGAWSLPSAQVMHPPPNGLSHLLKRSLLEGHDSFVDARRKGHEDAFNRSVRFFAWDLLRSTKRLVFHRKRVWLSLPEVIPAMALTTAICLTRWVGFWIAPLAPQQLKRMAASV